MAIFFNDQNFITFKEAMGEGTNNFAKFIVLSSLLSKAIERGCRSLQIFGDSMMVINWENGTQRCHIMRLLPFMEEIFLFKQHFDFLSITHVYRERNWLVDALSKEGA